jgi:hypothetical protein
VFRVLEELHLRQIRAQAFRHRHDRCDRGLARFLGGVPKRLPFSSERLELLTIVLTAYLPSSASTRIRSASVRANSASTRSSSAFAARRWRGPRRGSTQSGFAGTRFDSCLTLFLAMSDS